jgi:hypothetical protein
MEKITEKLSLLSKTSDQIKLYPVDIVKTMKGIAGGKNDIPRFLIYDRVFV